jgi:hypothetical protein
MELTDAQFEIIAVAIMTLPGMTKEHESDFVAEPADDGETYIKFMSDRGVTDDANGTVLSQYMQSRGHAVESNRPRSMTLQNADLAVEFLK